MAETNAPAILKKLITLQAKLVELQEQQAAIVDEMGKLLEGGPGVGELLKRLEAHFSSCWRVRYGSDYAFQFKKDVPHLKRMIRLLGVDEVEHRMVTYLRNADAYYIKNRHPFGLFVSTINEHARVDESKVAGELELGLQDEAAETTRMLGTLRTRRG